MLIMKSYLSDGKVLNASPDRQVSYCTGGHIGTPKCRVHYASKRLLYGMLRVRSAHRMTE